MKRFDLAAYLLLSAVFIYLAIVSEGRDRVFPVGMMVALVSAFVVRWRSEGKPK